MRPSIRFLTLCAVAAALAATPPLYAQGKGNDKAQQGNAKDGRQNDKSPQQKPAKAQSRGNDNKPDQAGGQNKGRGSDKSKDNRGGNADSYGGDKDRGNSVAAAAKSNRGKSGKYQRVVRVNDLKPELRRYATSSRAPERIAAGALGRGIARGLRDNDVVIKQNGNRTALHGRGGALLLDLDDDGARKLGGWRVDPYDDEVKSGAPAFCRSGEGHPVWGREWCIDKGFGLGGRDDWRWGRTRDVGDIIFRQEANRATLARDVLIGVLGDVVFNRLGLHAVTLGYSDPLTGVWLGEATGPRVLRLSSGNYPVAEIYDGDRDNRADALIVALRPW